MKISLALCAVMLIALMDFGVQGRSVKEVKGILERLSDKIKNGKAEEGNDGNENVKEGIKEILKGLGDRINNDAAEEDDGNENVKEGRKGIFKRLLDLKNVAAAEGHKVNENVKEGIKGILKRVGDRIKNRIAEDEEDGNENKEEVGRELLERFGDKIRTRFLQKRNAGNGATHKGLSELLAPVRSELKAFAGDRGKTHGIHAQHKTGTRLSGRHNHTTTTASPADTYVVME